MTNIVYRRVKGSPLTSSEIDNNFEILKNQTDQVYSDLIASDGASLVGFQQTGTSAVVRTAQDKLREWVSARDFGAANDLYSGLRGINSDGLPSGTVIHIAGGASSGDGAGGAFVLDATDTVSVDNGGTILVDASGGRWKRDFSGAVNVRWFGAKGDGATDDTASIQATINTASFLRSAVFIPAGVYIVSSLYLQYDATLNPGFNSVNAAQGRLVISGEGQCDDGQAITGTWGESGTTLVTSSSDGIVARRAESPYPIRCLVIRHMTIVGNGAGHVVDFASVHTNSVLEWVTVVQQHKDGGGVKWVDSWQYNLTGVYVINTANSGQFGGANVITGAGVTLKNPTIAGGQINLQQLTSQGFATGYQFGEGDVSLPAQSITQISLFGVQALKCGAGVDIGKGVANLDSINLRTENCATRGVRVHSWARNVTLRGRFANREAAEADIIIGRNTGDNIADTAFNVKVIDSALTQINVIGILIYHTINSTNLRVENNYLAAYAAGSGAGILVANDTPSRNGNAPTLVANRYSGLLSNVSGPSFDMGRAQRKVDVKNGKFSADENADGIPDDWTAYFGTGGKGGGIDAYGSGASFLGSSGAGEDTPIWQRIYFPANSTLRIGVWVKKIANAVTYHIRLTNSAGSSPVIQTFDSDAPASAEYREFIWYTGNNTSARIELRGAEFSDLNIDHV